MNKFIIPSFILLSSVSGFGQVLQLPLKIVAAPLNTWDVSWTSVDGRSYFFQVGDSLSLWHYASVIEFGDGALMPPIFQLGASPPPLNFSSASNTPTSQLLIPT
jgi:hypothetical protein